MDQHGGLTPLAELPGIPGNKDASDNSMSSSAGDIEAESMKSSYADSVKIPQAFFDQNCNAYDDENSLRLDLDEEEDEAPPNWGRWSPGTEKYWTLQYSDVNKALADVVDEGDFPIEGQRSSNGDTLLLINDEDGFGKETSKEWRGEHGNGPSKSPPLPPSNNRTLRQVTFVVCSRPAQAVAAEYDDPEVRARFSAKVLLFKSTQLLLILGAILCLRSSSRLQRFHQAAVFPVWTSTAVYVILLLSAKANLVGLTRKGAGIVILLQSMCVTEICFAIICNSDPYVILCILMTLSFTYLVIAIFCRFLRVDLLNSNNLFTLTWLLVFLGSIGILGLLKFCSDKVAERPLLAVLGHYWIPILLASETFVLLTLTELFQILQGNRIPLLNAELDWIQATAQLI